MERDNAAAANSRVISSIPLGVPLEEQLFCVILTAFAWLCIYLANAHLLRKNCREVLAPHDPKTQTESITNSVALLHGIVASLGAAYVIFVGGLAVDPNDPATQYMKERLFPPDALGQAPDISTQDQEAFALVFGTSSFARALFFITQGYLLYDLMMYIYYWHLLGGMKEAPFYLHHLIGILGLSFVVSYSMGYSVAVFMVFYEISTPFLHAIYFLRLFGLQSSPSFLGASLLFYVSFFFGRVVASAYLLYVVYKTSDMVVRIAAVSGGPGYFAFVLAAMVVFFFILNLYWFYLINKEALAQAKAKKDDDSETGEWAVVARGEGGGMATTTVTIGGVPAHYEEGEV